jgi:hypothetical protein
VLEAFGGTGVSKVWGKEGETDMADVGKTKLGQTNKEAAG